MALGIEWYSQKGTLTRFCHSKDLEDRLCFSGNTFVRKLTSVHTNIGRKACRSALVRGLNKISQSKKALRCDSFFQSETINDPPTDSLTLYFCGSTFNLLEREVEWRPVDNFNSSQTFSNSIKTIAQGAAAAAAAGWKDTQLEENKTLIQAFWCKDEHSTLRWNFVRITFDLTKVEKKLKINRN